MQKGRNYVSETGRKLTRVKYLAKILLHDNFHRKAFRHLVMLLYVPTTMPNYWQNKGMKEKEKLGKELDVVRRQSLVKKRMNT